MRHIAFELANKSGLSHPFNMDNQSAGKDWLWGFLNRHQDLSIRSPTGTSLNRIRGFTRESVAGFFDVLRGILERNAFTPLNIWNMDETGVSSVVSPSNVIATKGVRQVRKITSGERGKNVTVVCCMNAAGTYVPPLFIFPRKRMADGLITGAPIGSLGCVTPSGWIDSETFIKWLKHFASFTKCSKENQVLLVLDGHHSHKTLEAVDFARDHGIIMLTLPPHCTHRLQPLDRTFFVSLKAAYTRAVDNWMVTNRLRTISQFEIAGLFAKAYKTATTMDSAVNGFAVSGIMPFDDSKFEKEFLLADKHSDTHDDLDPLKVVDGNNTDDDGVTNNTEDDIEPQITLQKGVNKEIDETATVSTVVVQAEVHVIPANESKVARQIITDVSPSATLPTTRKQKRRSETCAEITSSPYKRTLTERLDLKRNPKKPAQVNSLATKRKKSTAGPKSTVLPQKKKAKVDQKKKSTKLPDTSEDESDEEWPCLVCCEAFGRSRPGEKWVQCVDCKQWAHEACTPGES